MTIEKLILKAEMDFICQFVRTSSFLEIRGVHFLIEIIKENMIKIQIWYIMKIRKI